MYRDNAYYAPNIEIIEVKVEQGICASQTTGDVDDIYPDHISGGIGDLG